MSRYKKKHNFKSELIEDTDENKHYITIPHVKKISEKFPKNIKSVFKEIGVKIRTAYKTQKVGKYFFRKRLNKSYVSKLLSLQVYVSRWPDQPVHWWDWKTTLRKNQRALFKHIESWAYYKNYNNIYNCFKIIKTCSSYNDLLFTEALLIKKLEPNVNNQLGPDMGSSITIYIFK